MKDEDTKNAKKVATVSFQTPWDESEDEDDESLEELPPSQREKARRLKRSKKRIYALNKKSASLLTIPVAIAPQSGGREVIFNAFIDTGADCSLISPRAMRAIGVNATKENFNISSVSQLFNPSGWTCDPIIIRSPTTGYRHLAYEMLNIGRMPKFRAKNLCAMNEHLGIDLPPPVTANNSEVDILIGLDNPDLWIMHEFRRYRNVVAVRTALGWAASLLNDPNGPNRMPSKLPSDQEILASERSMHEEYGRYETSTSSSNEDVQVVNFVKTAGTDNVDITPVAEKLRVDEPTVTYDGSGVAKQREALLSRLNEQVAKHWAMEDFPEEEAYTKEEQRCLNQLDNSYEVRDGKAYVAPLWKEGQPEKGLNNYPFALARMRSVHKKLDDVSWTSLNTIFEEYIAAGIVEKVNVPTDERFNEDGLYWAMFPVVNKKSETTPVRPVMDGAAKCLGAAGKKKSINDVCFSKGPNLINDLTQVLTRFRRYNVGIMGDVSKMFLKVQVPEEFRKYYRFLWCSRDGSEVYVLQFCGHLFGNNGSPTCAIWTTQRNARDYVAKYPRAVEMIVKSTIVDDHIDSVPTDEEAIELIAQLVEIHANIGLKIAKFNSNSKAVSANLPEGTSKSESMVSFDSYVSETAYAPGTEKKMPQVRTLGQQWNMVGDHFTFGDFEINESTVWTKAACLSQAHKVFDPLGFVCPLMLEARIFLQGLWVKEFGWEDAITPDEIERWNAWLPNLARLKELKFPRVLLPGLPGNFKDFQVHVFSDASKEAYAAVAYVRLKYSDTGEVYTNFIQAKNKIVPKKIKRTIPKLELQSIELASCLARHVAAPLEFDVKKITLWSDSKTALQWLRMDPNHLQVLVHNYVNKIHRHHDVKEKIRWVPGEQNPSDIATRQKGFDEYYERIELWTYGPPFLRNESETWPVLPALEETSDVMQEVKRDFKIWRQEANCFALSTDNPPLFVVSDYMRAKRITAYVLRFIEAAGKRKAAERRPTSLHLTPSELRRAELCLAAQHQRRYFETAIELLRRGELPVGHVLRRLGAELHLAGDESFEFEVLRLGGRTKYAAHLREEVKCPLLLDPRDPFVGTIARFYHERVLKHGGGVKCLLCEINRSFWVIGSLTNLKRIITDCVECRKANPRPKFTIMAPLPDERIPGDEISPAFSNVAIDAAGPWLTTHGRGRAQQKRWLLVIRCALSGAVHLEMLYALSEEAFLRAFMRFTARQMKPRTVFCDRGTNFVGGQNAIREEWTKNQGLADAGIEFRFSPAHAPHFNGLVERIVQSAKRALSPILKDKVLTDEDLVTAFTLVEEVINNRPIAWRGEPDARDPEAITPAHFSLRGRIGQSLLPVAFGDEGPSVKKTLKALRMIQAEFYRRFCLEILPTLRAYDRWRSGEKNELKEGDVVVVLDQETARAAQKRFPLGRVIEAKKGRDGIARRYTVLVKGKEYKRALNQLALVLREDIAAIHPEKEDPALRAKIGRTLKRKKRRVEAANRVYFVS